METNESCCTNTTETNGGVSEKFPGRAGNERSCFVVFFILTEEKVVVRASNTDVLLKPLKSLTHTLQLAFPIYASATKLHYS